MSSTWEVEPRPGSTMSTRPLLWNCLPSSSLHSGLWWKGQLQWSPDNIQGHSFIVLDSSPWHLFRWLIHTNLLIKFGCSFIFSPEQAFSFLSIWKIWEISRFSSLFPFWLIILFLKSFLSLHFTINGLEKPGHSFNSLRMYFFSQITNLIAWHFWILLSTKQ